MKEVAEELPSGAFLFRGSEYATRPVWLEAKKSWCCPKCSAETGDMELDHIDIDEYGMYAELRTYLYTCECGEKVRG